jgi:PAS domain S-box-containing protein
VDSPSGLTNRDLQVVMDSDGIITLWNAHAESIFGWHAQEAVGKRMSDLIVPPRHRAAHIRGLKLFLQTGATRNIGRRIEIEALRRSGECFQVELAISLLPTSTGLCFSAFIRDITERKTAEAAIEAANRRFQAVVENVQEGIMVVQDDVMVYVNPAMHTMLGYEGQELIGMKLLKVLVPEEHESAIALGRRRLAGLEPNARYEAWMLKKDGHSRIRVDRNITVMQVDGRPALLGVITDITETRRAEQSLKEANEKYRLMVEHPKTGMFISRDLVFLYANPALHDMLGYAPGELIGMDSRKIIAPEDLSCVMGREARRMQGLPTPTTEIRMLRKGGAGQVVVEAFTTLATYNGAPAMLGSMHDITSRKQAEAQKELLHRQLLQAQKMEAIGQLTGGIAHDFNNILMSIRGYGGMALAASAQGRSAQVAEDLQEVQAQVDRASDLVAKLLAFARGKSSGADALDITATIDESFRMLRAVIPSGIELTWSGDPDLPPVAMDRVQLQQVLMNLCINARDAQDGKGRIEIKLDSAAGEAGMCQSCFQEFTGDFVRLCVSDQGPGIDPELLQRIFEPFFSTKEVGRGSGMGLAMVHGIVHEHGGHIQVGPNGDRGTSFNLFLPIAAGAIPEAQVVVSEVEPPASQPAQLMVVDDEPSLCRYLARLLRGKGYTVHAFDDPALALRFFNDNMDKVDLLLTDKTMPGMNGLELAEQVRSKLPELPVIIATGYADSAHEDEAERLGIYALLKKPASADQILTAVSSALDTAAESAHLS